MTSRQPAYRYPDTDGAERVERERREVEGLSIVEGNESTWRHRTNRGIAERTCTRSVSFWFKGMRRTGDVRDELEKEKLT